MSPNNLQMLSVEDLVPHPDNPRDDLGDPQELAELANDIAANGNTIRLRVFPITEGADAGKYLIIEGHRRTEAAKLGGVAELEAWVDPNCDTQAKQIEAMLRENTHRAGITPSNEAKAIQTILGCPGMNVRKVAKAIHRSESFIRQRSRLAHMPPVAHQLVDSGGLTLEQSTAFDEFKDDEEAYQRLILVATSPHVHPNTWNSTVQQLRTKRDEPAKRAESEALVKELGVEIITREQSYGGRFNRDYQAHERTPQEHAAAGEVAFINTSSGQLEWYRKSSTSVPGGKAKLTDEEREAKRKLKDLEAGLEQDLAIWDEHLRRCLTEAGGGLPLTDVEKRIRSGLAGLVITNSSDYEQAVSLLLPGQQPNWSGDQKAELHTAIGKLRPLQLTMLLAELHIKPQSLHKPANWDPTTYGWRENEGVPRWILVRQDLFNYPPSIYEQETMDHFRELAATKAASTEDQADD